MDIESGLAPVMAPEISPEVEYENAELGFQEFRRTGHSDRHCLRCGGKLLFEDKGVAYAIWCERGDFRVTVRGI
jgi:hypothetical protein